MAVPVTCRSDPVSSLHSPIVDNDSSTVQEVNSSLAPPAADIPKSISSSLEAVVSDLPSLATSSGRMDDNATTGNRPPKVATGDPIHTVVPCQAAWSETTPTNDIPTVDASVEVSVFCALREKHSLFIIY